MDSDEDMDDSFYSVIDQLVAQHKEKHTQLPPQPVRGSQPSSPYLAPPAASGGRPPRQAPAGQLPPTGLFQQQSAAPLQQINGIGPAACQIHKPPLVQPPRQQAPPPRSAPASGGAPPPPGAGSGQQQWAQPPHGNGAMHPQDLAAHVAQLQAELSRSEGQNKLLASNVQHKDRELSALRQQKAQLERAAAAGPGGAAAAGPQRPSFALGELQRQLESMQRQLAFKEAEMEDLRRQYAERTERLRQTDATLAELREQQRQAAQEAAAAGTATAAQEPGGGSAAAAASLQQRPSAGQASSAATEAAQRGGSQKRRQPGSGAAASGATPAVAAAPAVEAAADAVPAPPAAAAAAAAAAGPMLDPAVMAAASSLTSSASLVAQLMAACNASMALLAGAAAGPESDGSGAGAGAAAAASTALLLRSRLAAAAARARDADSLAFVAAFSQRVQQVACSMLPPCVLLDSIGSLVAASMAQLQGASGGDLPEQRLQLLAAGLHVAQHLIELDAGCQAAALAPVQPASGGGLAGAAAPRQLSSRVRLCGGAALAAAPASSSLASGSGGSSSRGGAALLGTALLVQRHAPVFAGLHAGAAASGGVLLPVALSAALVLGPRHEGVAAGALGTILEVARAMQEEGQRAVLAPVLTTGTMELFMQAPPLRLQALRLLHLLLEDAALAALFEGGLRQAAAARGEPGPPTATAATGGSGGQEGAGGSATPGRPLLPAPGAGFGDGDAQPMQLDVRPHEGEGGEAGSGPWIGAAAIAERLLESFVLDGGTPAHASGDGSAGAAVAAAAAGSTGSAPASDGDGGTAAGGSGGGGGVAAARAAMALVAMLREQRQHGILVSLLLDDACGAPGCMLAQRLVQLAEAASALPGDDASLMLLCPAQWPSASAAAGGGGGATLLQQQAAWQQRLRVVQEALTLLRGLLVDDSCGVAAMDDLVTIPGAARLTLTTLSRLARLEPAPPAVAGVAPLPPPLLLAPWARAIGSSTDHPSIAEASIGGGGAPGWLPGCSVVDVVYMAKSARHRVLARMQQAAMQQG